VEQKVIQPLRLNLERFKREYKRLEAMTTFQRCMDKAIDAKADKWLSYYPLSREQLFDTCDENMHITIVALGAGGQLTQGRSTRRGATWLNQYTVIKRPTEMKGILHAQGLLVIESDFIVVRQEPNREIRYCIVCKRHHEVADFVSHKRYLNGLSYACKRSLADGTRGIWRKAA
jgi:hypothetical protein